MPLYEVATKGLDAKRLIEAASHADALRHCSHGMFTSRTVTKPADIAALMGAGVKLEQAGVHPVDAKPEADEQEERPTRVNTETGFLDRGTGIIVAGAETTVQERPATVSELLEAFGSGTVSVDLATGKVVHLADDDLGLTPIRDATPEEIEAATPPPEPAPKSKK